MRSHRNESGIIDYIILLVVFIAVVYIVSKSVKFPPEVESLLTSLKEAGGRVLGSATRSIPY